MGLKIKEIPSLNGEERSQGSSRFKIIEWLPDYLRWYFYGLGTTWLRKRLNDKKRKTFIVTGGTGFIGAGISKLLAENYKVKIFDNNSRGNLKNFQTLKKSLISLKVI